jgi:hypothetical protein
MASFMLLTTFLGTENLSENTESRAGRLAEAVGLDHLSIKIDLMMQAILKVFSMMTGQTPRFSIMRRYHIGRLGTSEYPSKAATRNGVFACTIAPLGSRTIGISTSSWKCQC